MTWVLLFFVVSMAYLGFRLVRAIEALVKYVIRERPTSNARRLDERVVTTPEEVHARSARTVAELPPDLIAPNLRKPPKSRGGVGSRVRTNDDIQTQPRDGIDTGSEGSGGSTCENITDPPEAHQ
jgi:hypothetical protein